MDHIRITFLPPKALQVEKEREIYGGISEIINTLKGLGVPEEELLRQYLPEINWSAIRSDKAVEAKIEKMTNASTGGEGETEETGEF